MSEATQSSRREFVKRAAAGTIALGSAVSLTSQKVQAKETAAHGKRKSNINLGVRFNANWLKSKNDDDLRFFKQIGVDHVDITLNLVRGYAENGIFTKADLQALIKRLDAVGLKIERANTLGPHYLNAHLHRSEGQK
jgi:hypothetical protein